MSSTATDGKDWRVFKFYCYAYKNQQKLLFDIMLSAQNSFDIFVTTLQEQFMYGVKALSYDFSTVT